MHLYKIYALPVITFSCIPILYAGHAGLKKVQILQNKIIIFIHNIHWEELISNKRLHEDLSLNLTTFTINKSFQNLLDEMDFRNGELFNSLTPNTKLEYIYNNPNEKTYLNFINLELSKNLISFFSLDLHL